MPVQLPLQLLKTIICLSQSLDTRHEVENLRFTLMHHLHVRESHLLKNAENNVFGCLAFLTALGNWVGQFTLIEIFTVALLFGIIGTLEIHVVVANLTPSVQQPGQGRKSIREWWLFATGLHELNHDHKLCTSLLVDHVEMSRYSASVGQWR